MAVSEENYIRGCNSENNGNYWYINTANNELREVHKIMEIVKTDPETTISCVRLTEKLNRSKAEGRIEGKVEGKATHLINQVCKKMKKNKTLAEIAEELDMKYPPSSRFITSQKHLPRDMILSSWFSNGFSGKRKWKK